jgi:hypothetical protein
MLIIIGHSNDGSLRGLAHRLHGTILTPTDLASPGWLLPFPNWEEGRGVIKGATFAVSEITQVVTRLSRVAHSDLTCVRQADRGFAAREINALLYAWLTQCRCPVINRPSGLSISGEVASDSAMPIGVSTASQRLSATRRLSVSIIAGQIVELYSDGPMVVRLAQTSGVATRISEWATGVETPLVGIELQITYQRDWEMLEVHTLPRLNSERAQDVLGRYLHSRCKKAGHRRMRLPS